MNALTIPYIEESFELDTTPDAVTLLATFDKLSGSFGAYAGDIRAKMDEVMLLLEDMDKYEARIKLRRMNRTLVSIAELERYEKSGANTYELSKPQELSVMGTIPFLVESLGQEAPAGSIVLPTGQGKTRIPVVLREMTKGKIVYIAHDSNGVAQMLDEYNKIKTFGTYGTIAKDTKHSEDMVVTSFEAFKKAVSEKRIDPTLYDMIMIDEADVNGLSKLRVDFLSNLQKSTGVAVIGLSATEHQASGRKLRDFYKYDILNLPMPQSLPDLCRKRLLPKTRFSDIYLNADFYVTKKDLARGLQDDVLDDILEKQTAWFQGMVRYHLEHHDGKPCMFAFRNNKFNELFLAEATKIGLKLANFTGEETREERETLKFAFQKGELHGLIGSKMIGRGLDIAQCEVVYNSLLTYSPQLFWQLAGRGLRLDPENTEKQAELVSFLPLHLYDAETQEEFDMKRFPLSFGAFLDRAKIENRANWAANRQNITKLRVVHDGKPKEYDLEDFQEEDFVTMNEMTQHLNRLDAYGSYQGRPEKIAEMILANTKNLTFNSLIFILGVRGVHVNEFIEREAGGKTPTFSQEVLASPTAKAYLKQTEKLGQLTIEREKELVSSKNFPTLLAYHYPIIIALAQKCAEQKNLPFEDVLQIGMESIIRLLPNYIGIQNRFASGICIRAFASILKVSNDENFEHMYVPINMTIIAKKVEYLVEDIQKNRQKLLSREALLELLENAMPDITKGTRERALDIIERQYISVEDNPEVLEEVALDQELIGNSGYIEDPSEMMEVSKTYEGSLPSLLGDTLDTLRGQESKLIKLYYGMGVDEDYTRKKLGEIFSVSGTRIGQIEDKALRKLKHPSRSDKIREWYFTEDKIPYDGYGFRHQVLRRKEIDILTDKMKENTLVYSEFIDFFQNLDKRYHEYFYKELETKGVNFISHLQEWIKNGDMQFIVKILFTFNELQNNADIFNSIKTYLCNLPEGDTSKVLSIMNTEYYISSGKSRRLVHIFSLLPKLKDDAEITGFILKWMSDLPSKEYSTFELLNEMRKKVFYSGAENIKGIAKQHLNRMLDIHEELSTQDYGVLSTISGYNLFEFRDEITVYMKNILIKNLTNFAWIKINEKIFRFLFRNEEISEEMSIAIEGIIVANIKHPDIRNIIKGYKQWFDFKCSHKLIKFLQKNSIYITS